MALYRAAGIGKGRAGPVLARPAPAGRRSYPNRYAICLGVCGVAAASHAALRQAQGERAAQRRHLRLPHPSICRHAVAPIPPKAHRHRSCLHRQSQPFDRLRANGPRSGAVSVCPTPRSPRARGTTTHGQSTVGVEATGCCRKPLRHREVPLWRSRRPAEQPPTPVSGDRWGRPGVQRGVSFGNYIIYILNVLMKQLATFIDSKFPINLLPKIISFLTWILPLSTLDRFFLFIPYN